MVFFPFFSHRTKNLNEKDFFEGTVARDFRPLIFSSINPNWAPDSYPKIFSNSVTIRRDIRIRSLTDRYIL
jgi:hypothetical protein